MSLPDDDIRFLDELAEERGWGSRSAALQRAVRLLRTAELGAAYEAAFDEWTVDETSAAWDAVAGDGMGG